MAHIPRIQVESYNHYALCHIETGFFFYFSLVNLLDWDYSQNVGAKYSSLWKVLLLQYKHHTAVIKTNIIYFETEAKTSSLNHKRNIYGPYVKEKYHTTVY